MGQRRFVRGGIRDESPSFTVLAWYAPPTRGPGFMITPSIELSVGGISTLH
ncbi:predicted protein [Verticillium alfalfae VaMs.102]|uniref:Predicted protein n=1 Tax=Verticillium alfalfae (strain VaMs.102 / ATCC MYA-4576 / FGSC 10136) TaxID=526221 RepID=C9SX40_VERA1|nr:predicted protein [Verticillium alfalfae VaMs.102]EEY23230.1 predicted protein [Verticillium alfalfae VaMs.102]